MEQWLLSSASPVQDSSFLFEVHKNEQAKNIQNFSEAKKVVNQMKELSLVASRIVIFKLRGNETGRVRWSSIRVENLRILIAFLVY